MKITLTEKNNHIEMSFDQFALGAQWDIIDEVVQDLDNRRGVTRKAYHIWHWHIFKKSEAEEYVTYFYLKHE